MPLEVSAIQNTKNKRVQNVISALTARTQLGQILERASERDERFVVDRRGKPSVIIMGVRDYIRNIAPTPAAYRAIREEARRNGGSEWSMHDIDREIAVSRRQARKRRKQSVA
jgi:prevent-host-death family protein